MKRVLAVVATGALLNYGCGACERSYDQMNYESLTNEKGTIKVISGGQIVATYENAEVIYSDSDSQAMWIKTSAGEKVYISGDTIIELK